MKKFMLTTALGSIVAFGAVAQTEMTTTTQQSASQGSVPAFLVSDFTGKTIYTLDNEDSRALRAQSGTGADGASLTGEDRNRLRWTSSDTFFAARDNWDNIGSIDDVVMTQDGQVRGIILDVGGFLGFGAHTVMVEIQNLYFVADGDASENIDDFFVVIAMSQDELEALPEWNNDQLRDGFALTSDHQRASGVAETGRTASEGMRTEAAADTATAGTQTQQMGRTTTEIFGGDYAMLEGEDRTVDRLLGASVYDANGDDVGTVNDVVLDGDQRISGLLVDVGGMLGVGSHTVNLPIDRAQIGWSASDGDVRVQVMMTGEELEAMPEHDG